MASDNYTFALDPEGTVAYGQQYIAYGPELTSYGHQLADSYEAQVNSLHDWADEFKTQMNKPGGTLDSMRGAYARVGDLHVQHGQAAVNHGTVPVHRDGEHAAKLKAIEAET